MNLVKCRFANVLLHCSWWFEDRTEYDGGMVGGESVMCLEKWPVYLGKSGTYGGCDKY